jgi:hypothetical protein
MQIGIPAEILAGETRVAATPETVKKFAAAGLQAGRAERGRSCAPAAQTRPMRKPVPPLRPRPPTR